jgi:hypothetical protein
MRSTRQNRAVSDENAPHLGAQSEEAESAGDESEDEEEVSVRGAFFYWRCPLYFFSTQTHLRVCAEMLVDAE